jgi:6-phosphogluconolactonase/glucosamine-6-phosphate isomerase/deaminase
MEFVRADAQVGVQNLGKKLQAELREGNRVLWLVPGGSNIPLAVQVIDNLPEPLTKNLTIMLSDERYGPVGHKDSNFKQLIAAGFNPKEANFIPVLSNKSFTETCKSYSQAAKEQFAAAHTIIAQLGMGVDGHIAGILPNSPPVNARDYAAGCETPDFIRLTLTPFALKKVNSAFAFVYGAAKKPALVNLQSKNLDLNEQPAQILRAIQEAYIYNDQVEEEAKV